MAPNPVLTNAIDALAGGQDLTADQASEVLSEIMAGQAGEVQTGAFLIALRTKGETAEELVGLARTMRKLATRVEPIREPLLDTAGTGGGEATFNVSTPAALVAAAAGCAVAKHGNRSATSRSGSADLLEALGVRIDLDPDSVARCIDEIGFGFMFAPHHHGATKHVVPVRKELAVRTIFNFLGPLTNPAGASRQLIGVSDPGYAQLMADALLELACERALVVCSEDGLDEMSVSAATRVIEVAAGQTDAYTVEPEEVGLERSPLEALRGGDPAENAEIVTRVLAGEPGPPRDVVVLNAGAAIYVAGGVDDLAEGAARAQEAIDSGAARELLARLVTMTNE